MIFSLTMLADRVCLFAFIIQGDAVSIDGRRARYDSDASTSEQAVLCRLMSW